MSFASPLWLALILVLPPILRLSNRRRRFLGHSQLSVQQGLRKVPLTGLAPSALLVVFWVALSVAMARPVLSEHHELSVAEKRDVLAIVDVSGSMSTALSDPKQAMAGNTVQNAPPQSVPAPTPATATPADSAAAASAPKPPTRAEAAQAGLSMFLDHADGDRVAFLLF
ncbi:MAG TPA: hypothetical protein V6C72_06270, partial [Chroococcales cyanobacterium]